MTLKLMGVFAHPDDESLGVGGALAKYASEGVEVSLITATRGQRGRFRGHRDPPEHPGEQALAAIRERELRAAADVLGVTDLTILDYVDLDLDRAQPGEIIGRLAQELRRVRPHVVVTFGPDGAYGHPDHIAISQFTSAAVAVAAAEPGSGSHQSERPHAIDKFYFMAWPQSVWDAYQAAFRVLASHVDGVARQAVPWPDWAITTRVDSRAYWQQVWQAVSCHESQVTAYERLRDLSAEHHEALWGWQTFYRVFSRVNGGRAREADLFEGLR